jgi:hypothetical protein
MERRRERKMVRNLDQERIKEIKINVILKSGEVVLGKDVMESIVSDGILYFWNTDKYLTGVPLENVERFELFIPEEETNGK